MRAYGKVETSIWQNPKFRRLSEPARMLFLYLIACPHGNSIGCFVLPTAYVAHDLSWSVDKAEETLSELSRNGFIRRDDDSGMVLITGWWGHNTIENKNVAKHVASSVNALPNSPLKQEVVTVLKGLPNLHETVSQTLSELLPKPFRNPEPNLTYPEPNQRLGNGSSSASAARATEKPQPDKPKPDDPPKADADADAGVEVIKAFDAAIERHFGPENARPWPAGNDLVTARRMLATGASLDTCSAVFEGQCAKMAAKGRSPPGSLAIFAKDVAQAAAEPPPKANGANASEPLDGYAEQRRLERVQWAARLTVWRDQDLWLGEWGPKPGQPGCVVPADMLGESEAAA